MNPMETLKADVRKIDKEFLDKYKSLPGLWDISHVEYSTKYHRMENLKKLLPILQKLKRNATIFDVRTKINTFRTNYRKEFNRLKNFALLNPDKKDFMKPRLWYFNSLLFLNKIKSKHNPDEDNELSFEFNEGNNEVDERNYEREPVSTPSTSTSQARENLSPTELNAEFSSFKPEPVYVEGDDDERGFSNVEEEPLTVATEDEIEPLRDPTIIMECEKQFLIMFKSLPGLWNPGHPYYTNRLCRRELKKIEYSRSDSSDSDVYKPRLWYYKYMSFLNDLEDSKGQEEQNTEDEASNDDFHYQELEVHSPTSFTVNLKPRKWKPSETKSLQEDEAAARFLLNQEQIDPVLEWEEPSMGSTRNLKRKLPKRTTDTKLDISGPIGQFSVNQDPQSIKNPIVFEWDETLSRLDSKQRLFAKKAINDILYEAELGNLHAGSVNINQSVPSVCQFDQPSSSSQFEQGRMRVDDIVIVKMEGGDPLS